MSPQCPRSLTGRDLGVLDRAQGRLMSKRLGRAAQQEEPGEEGSICSTAFLCQPWATPCWPLLSLL